MTPDPEFQRRLKRSMERHAELLSRLAERLVAPSHTPWTEPSPEVAEAIEALAANGYACPSCGYRPVGTARHQVVLMDRHRSEERRRVIAQANTGSGAPRPGSADTLDEVAW